MLRVKVRYKHGNLLQVVEIHHFNDGVVFLLQHDIHI